MRLVGWCAVLALVATSCAGGDSGSGASDTPAVSQDTSTSVTTATEPPATTATTTSSPPDTTETADVVDLASVVNAMTLGRLVLFPPDDDCVAEAVEGLTPQGRDAVEAMTDDPMNGVRLDPDGSELALAAYLGCSTPDALVSGLVFSVLKVIDEAATECVIGAWETVLTADMIAASLAHGDALDDLPPDVAEELGESGADCLGDRGWWIDDLLHHDELSLDVPDPDLECAASRYIDVFGIAEVIRRRMLGVPLLALPVADEATLDLAGACGIDERGILEVLVVDAGGCIEDYSSSGTASIAIECSEPHDAEAFAVHDLSADHATWPGIRTVIEAGERHCRESAQAGVTGDADYDGGFFYPRRRTWEQGDRLVTCLVVHPDGGTWTGPSGLVAAAPTSPPTSGPPPTTSPPDSPSATTLPPGAREMFALEEIDRVGMCIYRTPALPGQDDLERRFFEVDCAQPHQTELLGVVSLQEPIGAPYPGESVVTAFGDKQCEAEFGDYVGVPYASSRLYFTYFYPSAETWAERDREVWCFLVGTEADELFDRSMAGSGE